MPRSVVPVVAILLLATGCSGYRELARPWSQHPGNMDFESVRALRAGDMLRVTDSSGRVVVGSLVELDEVALTVATTDEGTGLVEVPVSHIMRLEVYERGGIPKAAVVVASSVVVGAIVYDRLSDGKEDHVPGSGK